MPKTLTLDGRKYRLTVSYTGRVMVEGPGVLRGCCLLPDGVGLGSDGLRAAAIAAVADYRARHKAAGEAVVAKVQGGTAGLGR